MKCDLVTRLRKHLRVATHRGFITSWALLATLTGCGSSDRAPTANELPPAPPLESVPFSLLGSGKVAFERIGSAGGYPTIHIIDATAMSTAHVFDGEVIDGPALSPDGRRLAYSTFTDNTTGYDVYVANVDGTGAEQVTRFPGQEGPPTWTPDGARVVVLADSLKPDELGWSVYSQSPVPNPGDLTRHTHFTVGPGGAIPCPFMSFNSSVVAVSTQGLLAYACGFGEIDVLSSNGALSATYVPSRSDRRRWPNIHAPSWSPDGTRLAFIETISDSATNYTLVDMSVRVMDADGSNVSTIVTIATSGASSNAGWLGSNNASLCWMPDGSRLVFNVPESDLVGHLWVVRADGTGLAQLTSAPGVWDRSVSCSR